MATPGPRPEVTTEDVMEVFHDREDASEPLTAPEIAETLGCSRRTALDRLHELEERDELTSKKVGGRSLVWWIAADDERGTAPAAPLRKIVGLLDEETAEQARERSEEWREAFDEEMRSGEP